MTEKHRILGVDYADDVEASYDKGELGDRPLIEEIMDHAAEAGMTHVAWRVSHLGKLTYPTQVGTVQDGHRAIRPSLTPFGLILKRCDPVRVAVEAAHERGLKMLFYICLFDECYELPDGIKSESWLGEQHPEYYLEHHNKDHEGPRHVRGVFSLSYEEVHDYFLAIVREGLDRGCDGVYLDVARTHAGANPISVYGWWPEWTNPYLAYGYNDPDVERYRSRYGEDPPLGDPNGPSEAEANWNRVRGEALTDFMRSVRPLANSFGATVDICQYPTTYNGFNPGYPCRQQLGRFHVDWETWAHERLIDSIRLNVDHGRFGYDDWMAHSAQTYKKVQEMGVRVYVDCGLEGYYNLLEDAPAPLPIDKSAQPELYFGLMAKMVGKMLSTSADGVFYYEHNNGDARVWQTLRTAHDDAHS